MTNTIATLFSGNLNPIRYLGKNNAKIEQLEALIQRNLEKLETSADQTSATILNAYTDCIDEYVTAIAEQSFCDGFVLGTKLVAEALTKHTE